MYPSSPSTSTHATAGPSRNTSSQVAILPITQATAATFVDLYIDQTLLIFIQAGEKRISAAATGEIVAKAGDLLICAPDSIVTLENRPLLNDLYRAACVCFSHDLVRTAFSTSQAVAQHDIQLVRRTPARPAKVLSLIADTLSNGNLPTAIRQHRLLEPLIWLRHLGVTLTLQPDQQPWRKVRQLVNGHIDYPWRASEVAARLAMSEATLRRALAKSGHSFSKVLLNTRLERGLSMLQTTHTPISQVAFACGFKTPSHFSDAFKKRFGIPPKSIRTQESIS